MAEPTELVVDDDPVVVGLLQVNFEVEGYRVLTASDGEDGLRRAQAELPDVVVLDVMMPRMDGLQVAARLRTGVRTRHIPIVVLSARAQAADVKAGRDVADEYITKPFDPLALLELVGRLLCDAEAAPSDDPAATG
jgi:CheY-like chemotaxis protein